MKLKQFKYRNWGRVVALASILVFALTLAFPLWHPGQAEAAGGSVDQIIMRGSYDLSTDTPTRNSCAAAFVPTDAGNAVNLNAVTIKNEIGVDANTLSQIAQQIKDGTYSPITPFNTNLGNLSNDEITYLAGNINKNIPAIRLTPGDPASGLPTAQCAATLLLPVSDKKWVGLQFFQKVNGVADAPRQITFENPTANGSDTNGKFFYWFWSSGPNNHTIDFTVTGSPTTTINGGGGGGGGGVVTGGGHNVTGSWISVSQIQLTDADHNGEVYQKFAWDKYNEYFLVSTSNQQRQSLTWGTALHKQTRPLPQNVNNINCVPFLYVSTDNGINFKDTSADGVNNLQTNLNNFYSNPILMYDYNTQTGNVECTPINGSDPSGTASIAVGTASTIWMYYNKEADAFETLFTSGDNHEKIYVGKYTKQQPGIYGGGNTGNSACKIIVRTGGGDPPATGVFPVQWNLGNNDCTTAYGVLTVQVQGVDQATFDKAIANTATTKVPGTGDDGLSLKCSWTVNPLTWLMCPIINAATAAVNKLNDALNDQLTINTGDNSPFNEHSANGAPLYASWAAMRDIAFSLLVLVALVMVISQTISVGPFDAYTVKKVLPRIVIAVIAISLSWQITKLFITVSNDLGQGVANLLTQPFVSANLQSPEVNSATSSVGIIGLVGLATAGVDILIILSLALTALGAVVVAFAVITFRNILAILLVIVAPLAILAWILPNTNKAWKLWYDNFLAILLAFPIIIAFITIGRIFAAITAQSGSNTIFQQVIIFIAYFGPYFALPAAFRLAGGFISTVGGLANDRSRGFFDRNKKYRQEKFAKNFHDAKSGNRYKGDGAIRNRLNKGIMYAGNANKAGLDPRKMRTRLKASTNQQAYDEAKEAMEKNAELRAIMGNDDFLEAGMASQDEGKIKQWLMDKKGYNETDAATGAALVKKAQRSMSGESFNIAAAIANAGTGTGYAGGIGELYSAINHAAGGDHSLAARMLADTRNIAERARRPDLVASGFGTSLATLKEMDDGSITAAEATARQDANTLFTQDPRAIVTAKPKMLQRLLPLMQSEITGAYDEAGAARTELDAANASGDATRISTAKADYTVKVGKVDQTLAKYAAMYDQMAATSPENAEVLAKGVLNNVGVASRDDKNEFTGQMVTVRQAIEEARQRPAGAGGTQAFLDFRREYGTRLRPMTPGEAAAADAAARFDPTGGVDPGDTGGFP